MSYHADGSYWEGWHSVDEMWEEFSDNIDWRTVDPKPDGFPTNDEILFSVYACGSYEGESLVLYRSNGKLYLNEASHCSCYGLEGQWRPVEVVPEMLLRTRMYLGEPEDDAAWKKLVEEINEVQ